MGSDEERFLKRQAEAQERMASALVTIRNQLLGGLTPQEVSALRSEVSLLTSALRLSRERLQRAIAIATQPTRSPS